MTYTTPPDFTAFDVLTAAQMDILGNNDLAFHDGTGILAVPNATGIINAASVDSLKDMGIALSTYRKNTIFDHVISGCEISADSAGSSLNWSMTAGVVMINGRRLTVGALSNIAATASRDTYVDVLDNADGTASVVRTGGNVVTNNNTSPALAANSIRIGIVVSGAGSIASSASINQGQKDRVLPIASSIPYRVTDSLGNLICPRDPNRKLLGYQERTTSATATTQALITGLTSPIIIPAYRKAKVTIWSSRMSNDTSGDGAAMKAWDGTVGSGTNITSGSFDGLTGTNPGVPVLAQGLIENTTSSPLSKTINVSLERNTGGTATLLFTAVTGLYATLTVELE